GPGARPCDGANSCYLRRSPAWGATKAESIDTSTPSITAVASGKGHHCLKKCTQEIFVRQFEGRRTTALAELEIGQQRREQFLVGRQLGTTGLGALRLDNQPPQFARFPRRKDPRVNVALAA